MICIFRSDHSSFFQFLVPEKSSSVKMDILIKDLIFQVHVFKTFCTKVYVAELFLRLGTLTKSLEKQKQVSNEVCYYCVLTLYCMCVFTYWKSLQLQHFRGNRGKDFFRILKLFPPTKMLFLATNQFLTPFYFRFYSESVGALEQI